MDFDAIVLLFAAGWAVLSWLARAARGQRGELPEEPTITTEDAEREVRRRQRMERLRARRSARSAPTAEAPRSGDELAEEFQRELERLFGVPSSRPESQQGPLGRQADTGLEGAEEVEDLEVLEEEPEVVSIETSGQRTERVVVAYDEAADALARRRVAEAAERARALTKADHSRFDARIRAETPPAPAPAEPRRPVAAGSTLRDAVIWSEILGPPVSERSPSSGIGGGSW